MVTRSAPASPRRVRLAAEKMAVWAGTALNVAGRSVPGVVGPLMILYGLYLVWTPMPWLAAGLLVWLLDRRV